MNLSRGVQAIVTLGFVAYIHHAIGHAGDERNIRALARHLDCSMDDARKLYLASRIDGYGAAYRQVFPNGKAPDAETVAHDAAMERVRH
jgi:hypothetical protein